MTDIVDRLRERAANGDGWTRQVAAEAAAEIEWLRGERDRLAADYAKAQRDIVKWIEKAQELAR